MRKSLREYHGGLRFILGELSGGSGCGRIELMRRFLKVEPVFHLGFDTLFEFLASEDYVEKSAGGKRAPYVLTVRGWKLLEALS